MWSIGGAALAAVLLCAVTVAIAMRRAGREVGPTLHSFDALRADVRGAIDRTDRDAGRARAGKRVLLRHGIGPSPR